MRPPRTTLRRLRFALLETIILPLAMPCLRLIVRTWRLCPPDTATLDQLAATPRLLLVTFHGMFLPLLGFWRLPTTYRRRLVVMLSPSRDGRLLAAALAHLGIDHVYATKGSRGVAGSLEFIRRVRAGDIGVIAADGPRGPCCVAKPGFLHMAAAAPATIALAAASGGPAIPFGSWDRAHLPLPFARVHFSLQPLPPPASGSDTELLAAVQDTLLDAARGLRSPVLPPALRRA